MNNKTIAATLAAAGDTSTAPHNKFVKCILDEFRGVYGGAYSNDCLSPKLIATIVRSIAFGILAEQDEATDLNRVMIKMGEAVAVATARILSGDVGTGKR